MLISKIGEQTTKTKSKSITKTIGVKKQSKDYQQKRGKAMTDKTFMTIRETAKTGILSEHALRIMQKQGKIPYVMCGTKCLINYPLLVEMLTEESQKAVTKGCEHG